MTHRVINICAPDHNLLTQVALIHINEISSGFLTTLGPKVLTDLYQTIAQSEGSFLIAIVTPERQVLGFLAGSKGTHSLYREFLRLRSLRSKIALVIALIRPSRIFRILETLRYSENNESDHGMPQAEILNFCVAREGQRQGLGKQLMYTAKTIFKEAGINNVRIVTGHSQKSAQEFYRKFGTRWTRDVEIHKGTSSSMFVWDINIPEVQDKKK